jgi:translation initiation factor 6
MAERTHYENSNEIGVFTRLTNSYMLCGTGAPDSFYSLYQSTVGNYLPVIITSITGTKIVGTMTTGNKKGLLVPESITDSEYEIIRDELPEEVVIKKIDDKLSALGNCIACNDQFALIHPEMDADTEEIIANTLGVEVFRTAIAGNALVGSYCVFNNNGGVVHPLVSVAELDELSSLLQLPLVTGTVNRGSDIIGGGLVANDYSAFVGMDTTSTEINVIDTILKIQDPDSDLQSEEAKDTKSALLDALIA